MTLFTHRSHQKELLDGAGSPFADIQQNMQELESINHKLGGHKITLQGVAQLLENVYKDSEIHIVEIGCGGGDNLRVIKSWCTQKGYSVTLTGVDINKDCIVFAESKAENSGIDFICSDYSKATFKTQPSIIFSSLFCHHFKDDELVFMFQWMKRNATLGFFINDLHRHWLAYYSIRILTRLFSKSQMVKNDAPLSVQRSFKKKELMYLFKKAQIKNVSFTWKWAFRWLVIYKQ